MDKNILTRVKGKGMMNMYPRRSIILRLHNSEGAEIRGIWKTKIKGKILSSARCTMRPVLIAEPKHRFPFSQVKTGRSTAKTATQSTRQSAVPGKISRGNLNAARMGGISFPLRNVAIKKIFFPSRNFFDII